MPHPNDLYVDSTYSILTQDASLVKRDGSVYEFNIDRGGQPSWLASPSTLRGLHHKFTAYKVNSEAARNNLNPNYHDYALYESGRIDLWDGFRWLTIRGGAALDGEFLVIPPWAAGNYAAGKVVTNNGFYFKSKAATGTEPPSADWCQVCITDLFLAKKTCQNDCVPEEPEDKTFSLVPVPQTAYLCGSLTSMVVNQMRTSYTAAGNVEAFALSEGDLYTSVTVPGTDPIERKWNKYAGIGGAVIAEGDISGDTQVHPLRNQIVRMGFATGIPSLAVVTFGTNRSAVMPIATSDDTQTYNFLDIYTIVGIGGHPTPGKILIVSVSWNPFISLARYELDETTKELTHSGAAYYTLGKAIVASKGGCFVDREGYATLFAEDVSNFVPNETHNLLFTYWGSGDLRSIRIYTAEEQAFFDMSVMSSCSSPVSTNMNSAWYTVPADIEYTCPRMNYLYSTLTAAGSFAFPSTPHTVDVSNAGWFAYCADNNLYAINGDLPNFTNGGVVFSLDGIADTTTKLMAIINDNLVVYSNRPGHEAAYITVMVGISNTVDYEFSLQSLSGGADTEITGMAGHASNLVVRTANNTYYISLDGGPSIERTTPMGGSERLGRGDRLGVLFVVSGYMYELEMASLKYLGYKRITPQWDFTHAGTNAIDILYCLRGTSIYWYSAHSYFDNPLEP